MNEDKKHFLDKPILRHLFWFIVMPYNLRQYVEAEKFCDANCVWTNHHQNCNVRQRKADNHEEK